MVKVSSTDGEGAEEKSVLTCILFITDTIFVLAVLLMRAAFLSSFFDGGRRVYIFHINLHCSGQKNTHLCHQSSN